MIVTSAQANKMLEKLNAKLQCMLTIESEAKLFNACVGENVEEVRPDYDFKKVQDEIDAIEEKIRKIKHAINMFNANSKIPEFDMTIDEMLVYLPQLNNKISKYTKMATHLPRQRVRGYTGNLIDYEYANYDVKKVNDYLNDKVDELKKAQNALDLINTTVTFEIPDC